MTTRERTERFGEFEYSPVLLVCSTTSRPPPDADAIIIHGGWVEENIVVEEIPQLSRIERPARRPRVRFHKNAIVALKALWQAWDDAGLLDRVISHHGTFVPRFIRGSDRTRLSNHSWGTAFDINAPQNRLGQDPALVGSRGCVRELVEIANQHGFFWGGHFHRRDGMHFEIGKTVEAPAAGRGTYRVGRGDTIASIALQYGHDPDALWQHPSNRGLVESDRANGMLAENDEVDIPPLSPREESVDSASISRFIRSGSESICVRFMCRGASLANTDYSIEVDGDGYREGTTDANGVLIAEIRPGSRHATVLLLTGDGTPYRIELDIGALEPNSRPSGIEARASNLGYAICPDDVGIVTIATEPIFSDAGCESITNLYGS